MPRPKCCRKISSLPSARRYGPEGDCSPERDVVALTLDEFEAVRLADYEKLYHEAASEMMGVSRQTFGRIVETARKKIVDAVLNGKSLEISGGCISVGRDKERTCGKCNHAFEEDCDKRGKRGCPRSFVKGENE